MAEWNHKIAWIHMWLLTKKKQSMKQICLSWIIEVNERLCIEWSRPIIEKRRGTEKSINPSFLLSSLFLERASWSRFSAIKSHEDSTPTKNHLVNGPVIYPFIELPISAGRQTLTSDDVSLADKREEINAKIFLHDFALSQKLSNLLI